MQEKMNKRLRREGMREEKRDSGEKGEIENGMKFRVSCYVGNFYICIHL